VTFAICTIFGGLMPHGHAEIITWPKLCQKLLRVMSSNECLEHKCIDLSDCTSYLNQIWYRAQAPLTQWNVPIHITWKSKMAAAAILDFGIMSITLDWIYTFALKLVGRCVMAMQKWPHDQKSKPEVNSRVVIKETWGTKGLRFQWL